MRQTVRIIGRVSWFGLNTLVFLAATSALAQTDCAPRKDYRSHNNAGIVVADFAVLGTHTLDSKELAVIHNDVVASCFDEQSTALRERLYKLLHDLGYLSPQIEGLRITLITSLVVPIPVNVEAKVAEGQKCPSDSKRLLQFLIDYKSRSLEADPQCVMRAFAILRHDQSNTKAMVQLLDFERSDEHDDSLRGLGSRYPATGALDDSSAVPYLIDAIKNSQSELVRTNAASTVHSIYRSCWKAAAARLRAETEKAGATNVQKERLETAAKYINGLYGDPGPCKSIHGQPTTLERMQQELDESDRWSRCHSESICQG